MSLMPTSSSDTKPSTVSTDTMLKGVGIPMGTESSLSNWVGPYVTQMLGRGEALSNMPYQTYTGPLSAGESGLQQQAFQGLGSLTLPTMGAFNQQSFTTPGTAEKYMNPYLDMALQPQLEEARRQAAIQNLQTNARLTKAGAYGGGRQAIQNEEANRNLLQNLASITGKGYQTAYEQAANQFNTEQNLGLQAQNQANTYGLQALQEQARQGATQRDIEQQGIAADLAQFQEQRDYPYKQVQYMQSLLQGLPLATQNYAYTQPNAMQSALSGAGGFGNLYKSIFGDASAGSSGTTGTGMGT